MRAEVLCGWPSAWCGHGHEQRGAVPYIGQHTARAYQANMLHAREGVVMRAGGIGTSKGAASAASEVGFRTSRTALSGHLKEYPRAWRLQTVNSSHASNHLAPKYQPMPPCPAPAHSSAPLVSACSTPSAACRPSSPPTPRARCWTLRCGHPWWWRRCCWRREAQP